MGFERTMFSPRLLGCLCLLVDVHGQILAPTLGLQIISDDVQVPIGADLDRATNRLWRNTAGTSRCSLWLRASGKCWKRGIRRRKTSSWLRPADGLRHRAHRQYPRVNLNSAKQRA
jgi:hypothetical protein